jgi:hypothetical protein
MVVARLLLETELSAIFSQQRYGRVAAGFGEVLEVVGRVEVGFSAGSLLATAEIMK